MAGKPRMGLPTTEAHAHSPGRSELLLDRSTVGGCANTSAGKKRKFSTVVFLSSETERVRPVQRPATEAGGKEPARLPGPHAGGLPESRVGAASQSLTPAGILRIHEWLLGEPAGLRTAAST